MTPIRLDDSKPYLKRILKSGSNGSQRKTVPPPEKMDLTHQNLEGLTRSQLISVLEAHNLSPEKIVFMLAAFRML